MPKSLLEELRKDLASSVLLGILLFGIGLFFLILAFVYLWSPPEFSSAIPTLSLLPELNAALNAFSLFCLIKGVLAIRKGDERVHKRYMFTAIASSALFLLSYLLYQAVHGDVLFQGQGMIRLIYFFILISHIIGTFFVLPLILLTVFLALTGRFSGHKRLARWTFPIWVYVSVTGILIYLFLHLL